MKKITALLPMKGHSERVPGKNMRFFSGRPLYHCVAQTLQDSELVSTIVINTDSDVIAEDATKHFSKIKIHFRPEEIRGDLVSMNEIITNDLSRCDGDIFLQTHSTNPLLTTSTLDTAISRFFSDADKYDSLFSVTKLQTRLYWETGEPVNHDPQKLIRTQDLPPLFEENSNFYIFSKESFSGAGNKRIGLNPLMFPVDKLEALDIDEEVDFRLAETLYELQMEGVLHDS